MTKPATKDGAWCEFCQRFHASETCFEPGKKPMTEYERQYPLLKKRIKALERWIEQQGEQLDVCTFPILGRVCGGCRCDRLAGNKATRSGGYEN